MTISVWEIPKIDQNLNFPNIINTLKTGEENNENNQPGK